MHDYPFAVAALIAALAVYVWSILKVGRARSAHDVPAPAVTGAAGFERAFRAQQNTVEQIVLFIPLLALAAYVWGDMWAGLYGAVWCVGRLLYIETYSRGQKRSLGFMLSGVLSMVVLIAVIVTFALHHLGF